MSNTMFKQHLLTSGLLDVGRWMLALAQLHFSVDWVFTGNYPEVCN